VILVVDRSVASLDVCLLISISKLIQNGYAPAQKTLMLVDIVYLGWIVFDGLAGSENVTGFIRAHNISLNNYDFDKFVGGHVTRLGTP